MEFIEAILACFGHGSSDQDIESKHLNTAEPDAAAIRFVRILVQAEKNGSDLRLKLQDTLEACNWTENLAIAILDRLADVITQGVVLGPALKEAADKAYEAAVEFASEHPVYSTLIAIGILVCICPWVIEALGFGELGPIEGSFAAWWQSTYAGFVPKGSLYSFLQRLGMKWIH